MLGNLQGWHLIIILAIVLLLFGAPKLPGLARSVGQSMRIFKSEVKTMKSDDPAGEQTKPEPAGTATTTNNPAAASATNVTTADVDSVQHSASR
ncbi:twin-arginine translocase TatA/TatE family subunit [Subtercola sp. Z020]|nr:Sec-independent protein translocase subunit TatA [Subtercola sp. Z020]PPF79512.1 twin-arginine translocase TatA/TatE family subunit [Subtercola sp. Z020]